MATLARARRALRSAGFHAVEIRDRQIGISSWRSENIQAMEGTLNPLIVIDRAARAGISSTTGVNWWSC